MKIRRTNSNTVIALIHTKKETKKIQGKKKMYATYFFHLYLQKNINILYIFIRLTVFTINKITNITCSFT